VAEEPEMRDLEKAALPLPGAEGISGPGSRAAAGDAAHGMAGGEEVLLRCQGGPATQAAAVTGEWWLGVCLS
jgi:hypothetical protein